jgi:hypothetical protein
MVTSLGAAILLALALTACGGGGGGGEGGGKGSTACTVPAGSDGCVSSPRAITVGSAQGGKVEAGGTSYYGFTPAVGGTYQVSISGQTTELAANVMTDSFGTNVLTCDDFATNAAQVCAAYLTAVPTGIRVQEMDGSANTFSVNVTLLSVGSATSTYPTGGSAHDYGSFTGPVATGLDLAPNGANFFTLTANATSAFEFYITGATTRLTLTDYTSATYATPAGAFQCGGTDSVDTVACVRNLTSGTQIWFTVSETAGISNTGFDLNIQQVSSNLLNESAVSITVGAIGHGATIAPFGTSSYTFTATGTSHTIAVTSLPGPVDIVMTSGSTKTCVASDTAATTASCALTGLTATDVYGFKVVERAGTGGTYTVNVN